MFNPEISKHQAKEFRNKNRSAIALGKAERYRLNPNPDKARSKIWHHEHKEASKMRCAVYRSENRTAILEYKLRYRAKNKDQIRESARLYYRCNQHVVLNNVAKRRVLLQTPHDLERSVLEIYKQAQSGQSLTCFHCGDIIRGKQVHVDHLLPVSRGGLHVPNNLVFSCIPCNLSKHDKIVGEWTPALRLDRVSL